MLTRPSSLQVPGGLRCGGLNSKAEMYETLSCLPMTVKENLDRAALKVSHKQWLALELSERQLIRDLPGDTDSQLRELSDLVHRLVLQRCGEKPPLMSAVQQHDALPPVELPTDLAANARELGIELAPDHAVMMILGLVRQLHSFLSVGDKGRLEYRGLRQPLLRCRRHACRHSCGGSNRSCDPPSPEALQCPPALLRSPAPARGNRERAQRHFSS
jgi:hypothetical protein